MTDWQMDWSQDERDRYARGEVIARVKVENGVVKAINIYNPNPQPDRYSCCGALFGMCHMHTCHHHRAANIK